MNLEKESQSNTVEIFWLRRIAQNQPTAWVGRTRHRATEAITLQQLVRWFSLWDEALAKSNGSAETALRIEVTAWTDQPQRCDGSLGRSINFPNVSVNGGGRTYASF